MLLVLSKNSHQMKPCWHFFLIPFIFKIPLSWHEEVINFYLKKSIIVMKVFSNMSFYNQNHLRYMLTYTFSTEPLWYVILLVKDHLCRHHLALRLHENFTKSSWCQKKTQSLNDIPIMVPQHFISFYTVNLTI